jgi:starch synthase (maltosyl-transferring)
VGRREATLRRLRPATIESAPAEAAWIPSPRIYNLFPLLIGPVSAWAQHLPRIADLGFDTVYINPFHPTGRSGNLYDIVDHAILNPLFDDGSGASGDVQLAGFTAAAARHGLAAMTDLIVTRMAEEAALVRVRPEWFHPPSGGVAAFDWSRAETRDAICGYFIALVERYVGLGFRRFRCPAALAVPSDVWRSLIAAVRGVAPASILCADTLGEPTAAVQRLAGVGFDYLFNSVKWWDFRSSWLFDEDRALRRIAPTIGFAECHDTARLVIELEHSGMAAAEVAAEYRRRYAFAAGFSSGILMPMGFEWGWRNRLDNALTRPSAAAEPKLFDLSPEIAAVNATKATVPALNGSAAPRLLTPPDSPVAALARSTADGAEWAFVLASLDPRQDHTLATDVLLSAADGRHLVLDEPASVADAADFGLEVTVAPLALRVLRGRSGSAPALPAPLTGPVLLATEPPTETRVAIENVSPELDDGRYPVKRIVGDSVEVQADILRDGHDKLAAVVLYRRADEASWREAPMLHVDNDRWGGSFTVGDNARYRYTILAWMDRFESWCDEVAKKHAAGQDVAVELIEGRRLVAAAASRAAAAGDADAARLETFLAEVDESNVEAQVRLLGSRFAQHLVGRWPDRSDAVTYARELEVVVDRPQARFAAWYEMFPRSQGDVAGRGATFDDCIRRLPAIAALGFDILYLVPIHPIGKVNRKGRDNTLVAGPDDPGSPYAIGSDEGGHTSINPELGTLDDFRRFVAAAASHGMEIALDFAVQCAPDHPWVREHPEWFVFRPDGTIKYAENPPKKYQDIVNVDFDSKDRAGLWRELLETILFWAEQGVRIFRVDNPHTKPVPFWEWCIRNVTARYPDVIFLAEAFTRPKMMKLLAKAGFSQSYSYFTWRNTKDELTTYLTELTQGPEREFMQPNFFANTPDILPHFLQEGGRPAFRIRLALAATLSPSYGIYNGYELCEAAAVPDSEEYLHSEKYEYKVWDWDRPGNIKDEIAAVNRFRRANPAMRLFTNLVFCPTWDEHILAYVKLMPDGSNVVLVVVNLDPHATHEAALELPLQRMGFGPGAAMLLEEGIGGAQWVWRGAQQRIALDPAVQPAMVFRVTATGG